MSVQAITWALKQRTGSPTGKSLLVVLANYADEFGYCWPSQKRLMDDCELGERAVRTWLAKLERGGLIVRQEQRRKDGTRRADLIILVMDDSPFKQAIDEGETGPPEHQPAKSAGCAINRHVVQDQPARGAGYYKERTVNRTVTPSNEGAQAPPAREVLNRSVWDNCPPKLIALGLSGARARKVIGKWLKQAQPEQVLRAVDAAYANQTQDPAGYVEAALSERNSGVTLLESGRWRIHGDTAEGQAWRKHLARIGDDRTLAGFKYARDNCIEVASRWPMGAG